jgi:hypothetical protein
MKTEILKQVLFLANVMGACFLNGKPARLETQGRLPRVALIDGSNSACFNPSVVELVMIKQGGRFLTR